MSDLSSYRNWLGEFYQDVEKVLEKDPSAASSPQPEAEAAQVPAPIETAQKLDQASQEISALRVELNLYKKQAESSRYEELLEKFQKMAQERARLEDEVQRLIRENAQRRQWQASFQKQLEDMRLKVSVAQSGYEAAIKKLEDDLKNAHEENRILQSSQAKLAEQNASLQEVITLLKEELRRQP